MAHVQPCTCDLSDTVDLLSFTSSHCNEVVDFQKLGKNWCFSLKERTSLILIV